jgi:4-O-beta-D-mannosyl-D-glucose phosphorylase
MNREEFDMRVDALLREHDALIAAPNARVEGGNGVFERWRNPVVTAAHAPVFWRYDLDYETNPRLLERLGINAAFNSGAIELGGKIHLVVRVEGAD